MSARDRLALLRAKVDNRKSPKKEESVSRGFLQAPPHQENALKSKVAELGRLLNEAKEQGNAARREAASMKGENDTLKAKVAGLEHDLGEAWEYAREYERSYRKIVFVSVGVIVSTGVIAFSLIYPWWSWL